MKTKEATAKRIYELSQRIKADKDETEELREGLAKRIKVGQAVEFDTPEGVHRMAMCACSETILEDNETILSVIGRRSFVSVAKVGVVALRDMVAPEEFKRCVKAITTKETLKLLKGRG
jgi:hypothetical protein